MSPNGSITVKSITILRTTGTDKIMMQLDATSQFPELEALFPGGGYDSSCTVECRARYAETWLQLNGLAAVPRKLIVAD